MNKVTVEQIDRIRSVLMSDWDPIGIRDVPRAADEYDDYIWDIARRRSMPLSPKPRLPIGSY